MSEFQWVKKARTGRASGDSLFGASVINDGKKIRVSIYDRGMVAMGLAVGASVAIGFSEDGSKMAIMPNVGDGKHSHKLYPSSKKSADGSDLVDEQRTSFTTIVRPSVVGNFGSLQFNDDVIERTPNGEFIVSLPSAVDAVKVAA
jgi:hypothetical protein